MRKLSLFFKLAALVFCSLFISCSDGLMGHSVVLWNMPEHGLFDGDIVPVYIRSNITQVYVIGTNAGKIEVPLWRLTEPESNSKAKKTAQKYAEFKNTYASVALDGLPMRAEAVNTAKQVYRLRQNETVKPLYKGNGQAPMSGKNPLPGDWLRVLTSDGTQGWCFSYNLRMFTTDENGQPIIEEVEEDNSAEESEFEALLQKKWYPDNYKNMIRSNTIDTEKLNPSYCFNLDSEAEKISFVMPKISKSWNYGGFKKQNDGTYALEGIPVVITVKNSGFIVVRYTGETGKPEDFNLVSIEEDLNELVQNEFARREKQYEQIYMFGPNFKSASYGDLKLYSNHQFEMPNVKALVNAGIIKSGTKGKGSVVTKYFLGKGLNVSFDGVLTFRFEGMSSEVNFFYKMEEAGLRLEDATHSVISNSIVTNRGTSPLVMFFRKVE